jgi:hypothetical protein
MNYKALTIGILFSSAILAPAAAHHSFAMFDADKTVTMKGTVKELEWTNPHSWLRIMVIDQAGKTVQWDWKCRRRSRSSAVGRPTSQAGRQCHCQHSSAEDGSRGGQLVTATLPNGKTVGGAGAPNIQE